jgi:3-oxoacyl-[acyl-carrier protein] reductase
MASETLSVLVTGASRGIGRAVALALAREGYAVVVHGSAPSKRLDDTVAEIVAKGGSARSLAFDVTDREACRRILLEDVARSGAYYGIVANAGISRDATFAGMDPDDWDAVVNTDLNSFYNVVQPLVMPMVRRRKPGRIIVMSSVSGLIGNRGQVNYSAAKAGLIGAAKALAAELASRSITVNAIAPGLIQTEMVTEEVLEHALPFVPMKRAGTPEEVAALAVFLMSPHAGYITRQVISVNGGLS